MGSSARGLDFRIELIVDLTKPLEHVKLFSRAGAWCSGSTCGPVKAETAGSNPVAPAKKPAMPVFTF